MTDPVWELAVPDDRRRSLAAVWWLMAVTALLLSGLFVILIIASRMPGLQGWFPLKNFFHLAIVVHVDFSVLVWFAAFAAMLWSLISRPMESALAWTGPGVCLVGVGLISLGPFFPGQAIMSNYVPVLDNGWFLTGLSVFAAGVVVSALTALARPARIEFASAETRVLRFGVLSGLGALLLACVALGWSWLAMPEFLEGAAYYEVLFWGGGHVLQFAWVQFMLVGWLWLASASAIRNPLTARITLWCLLAGILPVLLAIPGYLLFDVGSAEHRRFFIWLMAAAGGLAAGPIGMAMLLGWWRAPRPTGRYQSGLRAGLLFSILLFGIGGMMGFLIRESSTIVPAHYHGCIVGITLLFMLLGLHLMPAFGFARPRATLVRAVPWIYGPAQLMHMIGLALAGGHGVQRKTAGAEQGLESLAQIGGMAVMGIGGLIAIVGGIVFLVAVADVLWRSRPASRLSAGLQHV